MVTFGTYKLRIFEFDISFSAQRLPPNEQERSSERPNKYNKTTATPQAANDWQAEKQKLLDEKNVLEQMVELFEAEMIKNNDHIARMNQLREQELAEVKDLMNAKFEKKQKRMQEEIDILGQQLALEQESCNLKPQHQENSKQMQEEILKELNSLKEMRLSEAEDRKVQQQINKGFLNLTSNFIAMYNRMESTSLLLASKLQKGGN